MSYVIDTGPGYIGIYSVRRTSLYLNINSLDASTGDTIYSSPHEDGVEISTTLKPCPVLDAREVNDRGYVEFGRDTVDHLGVESGDDVRVYETEHDTLLAVPASDDPRLQTNQPGGTSP